MEKTLTIDGMVCSGCANTVQTKFESVDGVDTVDINLDDKEAHLVLDKDVDVTTLKSALDGTNYSVSGEK